MARISVRGERTDLADTPVDRKEVAFPAAVYNTVFSVIIKDREISVFCIKDHSNVSNAFSKSTKSRSPGIFLQRCN